MEPNTRHDIFADTTRMDIHELVRILNENVGATVVQTMAAAKDRTMPSRWAKGGTTPQRDTQARLRLGYRVWKTVESTEGPDVALAWLMGANPRLDEELPVLFISELKTREVLGAAEAFVNDVHAA